MFKFKVRLRDLIFTIAFIAVDLIIYAFLGLLLMRYDDNYDSSKGEYWSWGSMTDFDKKAFIALQCWNAINITLVTYLGFRVYKKYKLHKTGIKKI